MFGIIDAIEEWLRDLLVSMITSNLTTLFDDVNTKVGTITAEVSRTPQGWNTGIFSMVRNLSENVIVPILMSKVSSHPEMIPKHNRK